MTQRDAPPDGVVRLRVGGSTRAELRAALAARGIRLNAHAEALLDHPVFEMRDAEECDIVERDPATLGLHEGGTLPEVLAAARAQGLDLCPPDTGPYLRLAMRGQADAPDSILSAGRSPTGALMVGSAPLSDDVEVPKGFYLRVVDGQQWLRGYRCDDEYRFSPADRFAFRLVAG